MMDDRKILVDKMAELLGERVALFTYERQMLERAMLKLTFVELCNLVSLVGESLTTASAAMREVTK